SFEEKLAVCRRTEKSIDDLEFALKQPMDQVLDLLAIRGIVLARDGRAAAAVETATALTKLGPKSGEHLVHAACILAHVAVKAQGQAGEEHARQAMALLRRAQEEGHFKTELAQLQLECDDDLAFLRPRPDFQQLLRDRK